MAVSTQVRLARRPEGEPGDDTYSSRRGAARARRRPGAAADVYLSLDPYMRGRMSAAKSYAAPVEIGDVIVGGTVCEVEESPRPGVRRRRHGAVLLRVADARHQRRSAACAGWTRPSSRLDRARGARDARLHGVRRTARDRPAEAGRDGGRRRGDRAGRVGRRPDRAGQGRPCRRHRRWRGRSAGPCWTSSGSTSRSTTAPPLRRRLAAAVPTGSTSTSRTSAVRSPARCSSG